MHVYHEGAWHRRTPDLKTTACGKPFHSEFCRTRREELTHPMSRCCFTEHEVEQADKKLAASFSEDQPTSKLELVVNPLEETDP